MNQKNINYDQMSEIDKLKARFEILKQELESKNSEITNLKNENLVLKRTVLEKNSDLTSSNKNLKTRNVDLLSQTKTKIEKTNNFKEDDFEKLQNENFEKNQNESEFQDKFKRLLSIREIEETTLDNIGSIKKRNANDEKTIVVSRVEESQQIENTRNQIDNVNSKKVDEKPVDTKKSTQNKTI